MKINSEGSFDMSDNSRSERPLRTCGDAGVTAVEQSLAADRRMSCKEIAENVLIPESSFHRALMDQLIKSKMFSKWIPHPLTPDQKDRRVILSSQFIQRFQR
ncbi:histone-lysine N-methyltransferase SETMAR [Plakobranchus ocellatus]|uniref:Histone-lysine N-methyltransferase SETMAR n=1 Tax=Plakobranchus ocellatus TaxID=259542 RepID=A0AAV4AS65_9GAST|nr:histone-lysine N-methyltransferase SETMAR [Plakobranchus ocellatus]